MEEKKNNKFKEHYTKHKSTYSFIIMIVVCIIIAKLLTSFVFISVMVDGNSMYSTLKNGDKAITDGLFYKMTGIDRFDIVIIEHPKYDEKLVKRVIGLPGEHLKYSKGVLYINGEVVEENFIDEDAKLKTLTPMGNDTFEFTLNDNEYYVMGDNRGNSADSRYFGAIKKSQIKGNGILLFGSCKTVTDEGKCKGLKLRWPKKVK